MAKTIETPVIQKEDIKLSRSVAAMNSIHQPVVVVVDNSVSMTSIEPGEIRSNLKIAEDMINEIGTDANLTLAEQQTVDFSVLNFHDIVELQQNWIPMSLFERNVKLEKGGCTSFYEAVIQSIYACKALFEVYKANGITCKRPQIFMFTDGFPTDDEHAEEARELCQHYLEGEHPKCRLHVILLPGSSDKSAKSLSKEIRTYAIKDCRHGLPTALDFINSSIVTFSSNAVGSRLTVPMNATYMVPGRSQGVVDTKTGIATTVQDTVDIVEADNDDVYMFAEDTSV